MASRVAAKPYVSPLILITIGVLAKNIYDYYFFHRFPNKPTIEGLEKCSIYDLAINAGNICKFEVSKILLR